VTAVGQEATVGTERKPRDRPALLATGAPIGSNVRESPNCRSVHGSCGSNVSIGGPTCSRHLDRIRPNGPDEHTDQKVRLRLLSPLLNMLVMTGAVPESHHLYAAVPDVHNRPGRAL
jgi:hypothetical protein